MEIECGKGRARLRLQMQSKYQRSCDWGAGRSAPGPDYSSCWSLSAAWVPLVYNTFEQLSIFIVWKTKWRGKLAKSLAHLPPQRQLSDENVSWQSQLTDSSPQLNDLVWTMAANFNCVKSPTAVRPCSAVMLSIIRPKRNIPTPPPLCASWCLHLTKRVGKCTVNFSQLGIYIYILKIHHSTNEIWITGSQQELAKPHSQFSKRYFRKENNKFKEPSL